MADIKKYFDSDSRTPCKYGISCYQTNKTHHEKYKHPPKTTKKENESESSEEPKKKPKLCNDPSILIALCSKRNPKNTLSPKNETKSPQKQTKPPKKDKITSPKKINISPQKEAKLVQTPLHTDTLQIKKMEEIKCFNERVLLKNKNRSPNAAKVKLKSDPKEIIKDIFLVEMPDDFYSFWEMCQSLCKSDPINALKDIKLKLVGPFDVLDGKVTEVYEEDRADFLRHWRYYYDPPEFQTVLARIDSTCYHMGYFRDSPNESPVFVASNVLNSKSPEKNGELKVMGQNLFAALSTYMEELKTDPFSRMKVLKFQKILTNWAEEKSFSIEKNSKQMEARNKRVVAKPFHGVGLVVPVDKKNDIGYRELAASNAMIKKILKGIVESKSEEERKKYWEQLQPVITFANIANDECDFGTSLELGLDLFTYGSPLLHNSARQLLTTAYNLLNRSQFSSIIEAHLQDRREGGELSVL